MTKPASHTPGPWNTDRRNCRVVIALNESANEKVATAVNTRNPPVAWANAKLIAASPDLLEACKLQVANIERWLESGVPAPADESKQIYDALVLAIAKATGDQ